MSTRKPAPASQPNGCVSCLGIMVALWFVSQIITAIAWTASALWSLTIGFGPTLLGAATALGIEHATDVPPARKQMAATCAFLLGLVLNALMLFWQPQLQPWVLGSIVAPAPNAPTVSPASTRSASAANAVSPATQNAVSAPPTSPSPTGLQMQNARWEIAPLVKSSQLTSRLTLRGRVIDVPHKSRFEFDAVRCTLTIFNNTARSSQNVEYSLSYFKANGDALNLADGFRDSTSPQLRDFGGLRLTRRFVFNARPGTTQIVVLNELVPRSSARQIRRAEVALTPIAPPAKPNDIQTP